MAIPLVSYMSAAAAVHALLLSLGGLMMVNSLRALSQTYQQLWESKTDSEKRMELTAPLYWFGTDKSTISRIRSLIPRLMIANLLVGCPGIVYSLVVIAFLSNSSLSVLLVAVSLAMVVFQVAIFVLISICAIDALSSWSMKLPEET